MPVDLSRVGLEGIEFANDQAYKQAATRLANAQARGAEVDAQQTEQENQIQADALKQMSDIAKGNGTGQSGSLIQDDGTGSAASPLEQLGALMIKGGAPKRGMDYLKAGVDIRKREGEIAAQGDEQNKTRLDNILKASSVFSQAMGTAKNENEWEYGKQMIEAQPEIIQILGEDNWAKLKDLPYSPDAAAFFNEKAMTANDRAQLQLRVNGDARDARNAVDLAQYRRATIDIAKANLDMRKREYENKIKTDGKTSKDKPSSAPSEAEMKSARTAVANLIFNGTVPTKDDPEYVAFEAGAQDIASRAQEMVKSNKAMDWNTAITRATMASQAAGDWETLKITKPSWFGLSSTTEETPGGKFRGKGTDPLSPLELPKSKNQMKTGAYYTTSKGIAKWDGTKFVKD